jgi:hypothetical protein
MGQQAGPPSLQQLVTLYVSSVNNATGYPTGTHAGIAAVLTALSDAAQQQAARELSIYDHRSLYAFAATLKRTAQP